MSETTGPWKDVPAPGADETFDAARHMMLYGDPDTASATFNLLEAAQLVLDSVSDGVELDRERLGRLLAGAGVSLEPPLESYRDEDGNLIYYDGDGNEVRREAPSPELAQIYQTEKARKQALDKYVAIKAVVYTDTILTQLAEPGTSSAGLSVLVERGRRIGAVTENELESAALNAARKVLKQRNLVAKSEQRRVGADGTGDHPSHELTHTLHILRVTREQ